MEETQAPWKGRERSPRHNPITDPSLQPWRPSDQTASPVAHTPPGITTPYPVKCEPTGVPDGSGIQPLMIL
jgi:hypothetical protein